MQPERSRFSEISKANCHLHLTGSLRAEDIRRVSKIAGIPVQSYEPLESHYSFFDETIWAAAKDVTSNASGLCEAIRIIVSREASDKVSYLELTLNPFGMLRRGMLDRDVAAVLEESAAYAQTLGTRLVFKVGVNRKDGPDSVRIVRGVYDLLPAGIKFGIDLNGNERVFPTLPFKEEFSKLISDGIPVCIHAGEFPELIESLRGAISIGPDRIAHAVACAQDRRIIDELLEKDITVESCPASNLGTKAVLRIEDHPLKQMIGSGVKALFGSDDPAFFDTTVADECELALRAGVGEKDVLAINQRGLDLK